MLGSGVIGTAIGLVLLFGLLALFCSGFTEAVSNALELRGKYLVGGLRSLLDETPKTKSPPLTRKQLHNDTKDTSKTDTAAETITKIVTREPEAALSAEQKSIGIQGTVTQALFDSPLIKALRSRRIGSKRLRNPQYISAETFRQALIDTLLPNDGNVFDDGKAVLTKVDAAVDKLPDTLELKRSLKSLLRQSEQDLSKFETALEHWYDEQMDRVSGWYKRWSRVVLGIAGFVVAVLFNIDTIQVAHALYVDAPLREAVSASATSGTLCTGEQPEQRADCVKKQLNALHANGLPIGYPSDCALTSVKHLKRCVAWEKADRPGAGSWVLKVVGDLLTGLAVSFGAPFWFEALSKLGNLRNSGPRPAAAPAAT